MAPAWAEARLEQLCCHIPWCQSGAAGLVCIYSRGSVHSTRQFLIYRLGGGPALPPPCHRHKCPPMGGSDGPSFVPGSPGQRLCVP